MRNGIEHETSGAPRYRLWYPLAGLVVALGVSLTLGAA